jgi:RHS repeat-associated protein
LTRTAENKAIRNHIMHQETTEPKLVAAQRFAGFFLFNCFPFFTAPAAKKEKTTVPAPVVPLKKNTPLKKCSIGDFFGGYLIKKEFDQEGEINGVGGIKLLHFGFREYDPEVGIWNRPDPMDEFWNTYSYVGANPINLVDPNGLEGGDRYYTDDYGGEVRASYTFSPMQVTPLPPPPPPTPNARASGNESPKTITMPAPATNTNSTSSQPSVVTTQNSQSQGLTGVSSGSNSTSGPITQSGGSTNMGRDLGPQSFSPSATAVSMGQINNSTANPSHSYPANPDPTASGALLSGLTGAGYERAAQIWVDKMPITTKKQIARESWRVARNAGQKIGLRQFARSAGYGALGGRLYGMAAFGSRAFGGVAAGAVFGYISARQYYHSGMAWHGHVEILASVSASGVAALAVGALATGAAATVASPLLVGATVGAVTYVGVKYFGNMAIERMGRR